ncbi:SOS response-associated peptidase family protein [Flavobacteriaceae bacterium KMM 6897]|nr:SOS response-associated peptidase family protein [Flavobacteriaceae bacterium KMM 6897]MEB8345230.1 SOS response-associated peptidase family protein [Flavobacteriaceae bacterium KMM 6898]
MYYKVSNTATRNVIENEFGVHLKYPRVHVPNPVINGLEEELLPIITEDNSNLVNFAVWGLLPNNYIGDWETYQQIENTLNIPVEKLCSNSLSFIGKASKRCLIVVTGYFVSHLHQGELYPYYVHLPQNEPFMIGGIYTSLNDGFITAALLVGKGTNGIPQEIHNLGLEAPLIIPKTEKTNWLEHKLEESDFDGLIELNQKSNFTAYPIAKEFYYRNIKFRSMLDPVFYETLPILHA